MSQEWKVQRECVRYGGQWRDGRCLKADERGPAAAAHDPVQALVDVAAERSREAWMRSGRHAAYLLAEVRPTADGVGRMRVDGLLLSDRARRTRDVAAAWFAAAEPGKPRRADHCGLRATTAHELGCHIGISAP
jgi:hypothetical protein